MKEPFLLPAGKVENREDLNRQLGFDEDKWPVWAIYVTAAVIVFIISCAVIGGIAVGIEIFNGK